MVSLFNKGASAPCPAPFNLAAHVLAAGERTPDKQALVVISETDAKVWTYAELIKAVRGTATGLLASGLRPGDILVMRVGNTVDFPIIYLGAIAAGIIPVPTSSQLTKGEVSKIIETLNPKAILRAPDVSCPETDVTLLSTEQALEWRSLPPSDWDLGDPNRMAYIIYTSGTSGIPRAVGHAHRAIWARQMMMEGWYGLRSDDRLLHAGAFNWTFTLGTGLMDPWTKGATALIPATGTDPFELGNLLAQYDASLFAAAPGVYRQMLKSDLPDLPALRHGLAAGEKLSQTIRDAWRASTEGEIYEAYGLSECSTFISSSPTHLHTPGTLGHPQSGRHIAILGETGHPVARGEEGTIAVHKSDPGLMIGYVGAPEATQAKFQGDWFLTGDRASMSDSDAITYLGRNDDMMNAGGFRVSPLEVEASLNGLAGTSELAVTDIAIKEDVRIIACFYTSAEALDEEQLKIAAQERLARYKCPRTFIRVDKLPRNPNGKLLRSALKNQFPSPK